MTHIVTLTGSCKFGKEYLVIIANSLCHLSAQTSELKPILQKSLITESQPSTAIRRGGGYVIIPYGDPSLQNWCENALLLRLECGSTLLPDSSNTFWSE